MNKETINKPFILALQLYNRTGAGPPASLENTFSSEWWVNKNKLSLGHGYDYLCIISILGKLIS